MFRHSISSSNRDNLKTEYRKSLKPNTQTYLGKRCIIMIIPITNSSVEVVIRNPVSNVNMVINSDFNIDKKEPSHSSNCKFLNSIINKKSSTEIEFNNEIHKVDIPITKPQEKFFNKINSLGSSRSRSSSSNQSEDLGKKLSENFVFQQLLSLITEQDFYFQNLVNVPQLDDHISTLDTTPVYYTFNCGIIYIPSKSNISLKISR